MFRFQRCGRVKEGKVMEAMRFAKQVTEHLNAKYPKISFQVYMERYGDLFKIYWYLDHEDIAAIEGIGTQLLADQEYMAMTTKGMEWFTEGSFHDTLMSSI